MELSSAETPISVRDPALASPCAGCKFLRRKCQPNCIFAPHFPSTQPQKFVDVHRVFGASNVTKILNDLLPNQREDAVKSLVYEAQMRLQDPVYGCVGVILVLEDQLQRLNFELARAWAELTRLEQQRMMMMMVVMSNNDSGVLATANGTGGGEDGWQLRGVEEYFSSPR